jgi:hypothetical protein
MHQHHIEVIRIRQLAQFVDLPLRVHALAGRHLRHQPVRIARDSFQSHAQHPMHFGISFGSFVETNAPVVSVPHQLSELILAKVALHLAAESTGPEREPRHFHIGFPQRDPIRCGPTGRAQGQASGPRQHASG